MLKSLFRKKPSPAVPVGTRIYAIGDIHGRYDLFEQLLALIASDEDSRPSVTTTSLILLGDLIDRGPDSAKVVDRAITLFNERPDVTVLKGNHEEILLNAADGDRRSLALFDRVGGRETLISYGVDSRQYDEANLHELADIIRRAVPQDHFAFLDAAIDIRRIGDYAFVHAGIKPGVALSEQIPDHLRWIRDAFLSSRVKHEAVIVHGHTITDDVELLPNRIGIDTGAYRSGRLSALGLEGKDQWILQTAA